MSAATAPTSLRAPPFAAPPAGPQAAVIDWAAVAAGLGATEAFLDQLAASLLQNLGPKPAVLRAAAQHGDLPSLLREAHGIKGVAGNLRAEAAFEVASKVESAARQGRRECLQQALDLAEAVEQMLAAARQRVERPR